MERLHNRLWQRLFEGGRPTRDSARLRRRTLMVLGMARASIGTLARASATDKAGRHEFMDAYARLFADFRNSHIALLEIGVGGYDKSSGGHSLDLWEAYFQRGTIIGIDVYDKTALSHGRVHVHQCSQTDRDGLQRIFDKYGGFDLIVDDGSHINEHQIESFRILFPMLKTPGVYVIEDTQTSYWPAYGGGAVGTQAYEKSATGFFKSLIDGLNHEEFLPSVGTTMTPFCREIRAIYFEHNLIAVIKGDNTGKSNVPIDTWADRLDSRTVRRDGNPGSLI